MSSTNRINSAARHVSDYYVTPPLSIREFLNAFNEDFPEFAARAVMVLDPCAGGDEKNPMSYPAAIENYSGWNVRKLVTVDVRPDSRAEFKEDFLFMPPPAESPEMIITNPPFNIALDIIQKSLLLVKPGGFVVMLLRLNFFGSQERSAWFKVNMPEATYVHSKRMRFTNTGGTDSIEYMHAVWIRGHHPKFTQLRIL